MDIGSAFTNKSPILRQRAGKIRRGPIGPALTAMSKVDRRGKPISRAGSEVATLINKRGVWVVFAPIGGAGACPFAGAIIIDSKNRGKEQGSSDRNVGVVGHELVHVLQRDRMDPRYWPSGLFRVNIFTRWFGDSTNFMEALSYIVGWTIEYDLIQHRLLTPGLKKATRDRLKDKIETIEDYLATLTGPDVRHATSFIVEKYKGNAFYRQNYRKEKRERDGRIPQGGWAHWLRELGFSLEVIKRIRAIARKGNTVPVNAEEVDEIAKPKVVCDKPVQQDFVSTGSGGVVEKAKQLRRLNVHVGWTSALLLLYMLIRIIWPSGDLGQDGWSDFLRVAWNGVWWIGIGIGVRGISGVARSSKNAPQSKEVYIIRWQSVLFVCLFFILLGLLFISSHIQVNLNLDSVFAKLDFNQISDGIFASTAWSLGFFHQLVSNFFRVITCIFWEGVVVTIYGMLGKHKEV